MLALSPLHLAALSLILALLGGRGPAAAGEAPGRDIVSRAARG